MKHLTLNEIILGMNMNRRSSNIKASQQELKRRGYHANYDPYEDRWFLS